jgi:hypothetical protein
MRRCKPIDPKALAIGTRVEKREHRLPKKVATRIARDHLCTNPRYYKKK